MESDNNISIKGKIDMRFELLEIAKVFLKLGLIAFGGPAVHIALFEDEFTNKRKWLDRQHFLDLVGATNLIPGPNSTEMALHIGYQRGGIWGLIIAGFSFIIPAVLITGFIAYLYSLYGNLPKLQPFLIGIKPAIIVIVLNAVYKLGIKALKGWKLIFIAISISIINFLGVNEVISIIMGGIIGSLFIYLSEKKNIFSSFSPLILFPIASLVQQLAEKETLNISLTKIFFVCLKIGAVWFGGGYVLVAYFNGEFVQGLGWLTEKELLDAIAVGQFTPGPFLSSATFIGYQISGIGGAIAATLGILIPSFIFVLILNPFVAKLRASKIFSAFLDAINASAVAVMFVVVINLGVDILFNSRSGFDWGALLIVLLSSIAFLSVKKLNSAYIVLGGAILGYLLQSI